MKQLKAIGPNVKKLIIKKMSADAIPPGGGFADGVKFLTTPGQITVGWNNAAKWVDAAILVIRQAPAPNPWKEATDELIARELLVRTERYAAEKKAALAKEQA